MRTEQQRPIGTPTERRADEVGRDEAHRRGEARAARRGARGRAERRARAIGWLSLGLGISMIAAPRAVARLIGVRDDRRSRGAVRAIGAREIAAGIGILTQQRPWGWVWARIGGDVTDLALLGAALGSPRTRKARVVATTAAIAGVTFLDARTGRELAPGADSADRRARHDARAVEVITVHRSAEEAYRCWRDLGNLPRFMSLLSAVEVIDERRSRWTARGPGKRTLAWDVELVADRPGEIIAWRATRAGASGAVRFTPAPGGRGTEVRLEMEHLPWRGVLGGLVAKLLAKAAKPKLAADLRRFKQLVETGGVVASDASVHWGPHPARPPAEGEPSRRDAYARGLAAAEGGAR